MHGLVRRMYIKIILLALSQNKRVISISKVLAANLPSRSFCSALLVIADIVTKFAETLHGSTDVKLQFSPISWLLLCRRCAYIDLCIAQ